MSYLFTSESVSKGHPDKVSDQISDAILDEFLRRDPESKVACETLVTTGLVVVSGEVKSSAYVDIQKVVREVIDEIGYNKSEYKFDAGSCGIISTIHEQSTDINRGVVRHSEEEQGAGDQGMMFGYACDETPEYMPLPIMLAHRILNTLDEIRKEGIVMTYLRPDAKSQVTVEYADDNIPIRIDTIVVSTQHDEFAPDETMQNRIRYDVENIVIPKLIASLPHEIAVLFEKKDYTLHVNPTGRFVIGGPHGDTGLTGRKIIVDTYGGRGAHGGGAFSGKDPSKVDRSAAYAARHIAKNLVAAGVCKEAMVQIAYAIGVAEPVGLYINTYGTSQIGVSDGEIAERVRNIFDLRPFAIVERFGLKKPIFKDTATYGHMGKSPREEHITMLKGGNEVEETVTLYAWEKLDYVDKIKDAF